MFEKLKKSLGLMKLDDYVNPNLPKEVSSFSMPMGSSGTKIFSGFYDEEYLQDLTGWDAAVVYDKMRRGDSRVKMCLKAVKDPIKSGSWEIEPAGDSEEEKNQAEFVKHVLFNDSGKSWTERVGEMLSVLDFGHCVYEISDTVVLNHPKFGTYNGIRFGFRSQKTIYRWILNKDTGAIEQVEQNAYGDLERLVCMPGENLMVLTLDKEGDNYEGVSALRACYGPWYRKQVYQKLMAIGIERNAVPTPKVKYPQGFQGTAQFDALVNNLKALTTHEQNYITYPNTLEIDFAQNTFSVKEVTDSIEFENKEMSYSFLENFLLLGGSGGAGSYAMSFDLSDFFLSGIEHIAQIPCEAINTTVIPRLIKNNFGPQAAYPKLKVSGISDKAGKEFGELLKILADGKFITPDDRLEENLRKRIGLPERSTEGQRIVTPPTGQPGVTAQFSEKKNSFFLAEKTPKGLIKESKNRLTPYLREEIQSIGDRFVQDLIKAFNAASPSQKLLAYKSIHPVGRTKYVTDLKEWLTEVANLSLQQVLKEIPKAKEVQLSETIMLSTWKAWAKRNSKRFEDLPIDIQKRITAQSELVVDGQLGDLEKAMYFKYASNVENSLGSAALLEETLQESADDFADSAAIETAATNASSTIVNESRNAVFFDDEVLEGVESFTFVNGDPVSDICQDLAGTTFSKDDAEAERYFPPLHHNCKSYIVANLVGSGKEIDEGGLKPSTKELEKDIQF